MMSTALLMLTGVRQTGKSAGPTDPSVEQGKPEGISFAKSFSDRVGESALLQGTKAASFAKDLPIGLPRGSNAAMLTKRLDAVVTMPGEDKELTHAVQDTTARVMGNAASSLGSSGQVVAVTGSIAKAAVNDPTAKNVGPAVEEGETADNVLPGFSASSTVAIVPQAKENVVVPAVPTDEGGLLVSSSGSAFVQKETESGGKTKEISSARKMAKISENGPTSKTVQKEVKADGNVITRPADASSREDGGPLSQGILTGVVVPPKEDVRTTSNRFSEAISGKTLVPSEVSPSTAGVLIHKETEPETKAVGADTERAIITPDGQPALTKFSAELEKVSVPTGNGVDNKVQSISEPGMMTFHSAAGAMLSGVAPLAVVSGNTPGETASPKPQVGDAGAHVTGPMVETREQGGLDVISASTEAIPTMLKATPTALEVGIQDGTHGWLKVRAEMADGGGVNALVSAVSSTGQEMLHRELPAITAYLQQEKVAVNAIAVHTPLAAGAEPRSSTGMDGSGGQSAHGHERREAQQNIRKGLPAAPDEAMSYQSLHGVDEDGSLSLATYASGGSWLSVRA